MEEPGPLLARAPSARHPPRPVDYGVDFHGDSLSTRQDTATQAWRRYQRAGALAVLLVSGNHNGTTRRLKDLDTCISLLNKLFGICDLQIRLADPGH